MEAEQWFPGKAIKGVIIPPLDPPTGHWSDRFKDGEDQPHVITIHLQKAFLKPGDWILPEPDGEHYYPVRPEIFANTYEAVE